MPRKHANRLVNAAKLCGLLEVKPMGFTLPTSERQVRPITGLPEDEQVEAWTAAVKATETWQPTAAEVGRVFAARKAQAPPRESVTEVPAAAEVVIKAEILPVEETEVSLIPRQPGVELHSRLARAIETASDLRPYLPQIKALLG